MEGLPLRRAASTPTQRPGSSICGRGTTTRRRVSSSRGTRSRRRRGSPMAMSGGPAEQDRPQRHASLRCRGADRWRMSVNRSSRHCGLSPEQERQFLERERKAAEQAECDRREAEARASALAARAKVIPHTRGFVGIDDVLGLSYAAVGCWAVAPHTGAVAGGRAERPHGAVRAGPRPRRWNALGFHPRTVAVRSRGVAEGVSAHSVHLRQVARNWRCRSPSHTRCTSGHMNGSGVARPGHDRPRHPGQCRPGASGCGRVKT